MAWQTASRVCCEGAALLLCCVLLLLPSAAEGKYDSVLTSSPKVLVISLDGFGRDYLKRPEMTYLNKLLLNGSSVVNFRSQFPTMTMPNHFSTATGLYVESHGVVGDELYDPFIDEIINSADERFYHQSQTVPIWIANELNGGVSACFMWPGCGRYYTRGKLASRESLYLPFQKAYDFRAQVDAALYLFHRGVKSHAKSDYEKDLDVSLLSGGSNVIHSLIASNQHKSEVSPNLIMMYSREPDRSGHQYGTHSKELSAALKLVDGNIGYLVNMLAKHKMDVNVILMSDHGMVNIYPWNIISLDNILDSESYSYAGTSPLLNIYPKPGKGPKVMKDLLAGATNSKYSVLLKSDDLPSSLHYKDNVRVADILLQAAPGHVFDDFPMAKQLILKNDSRGFGRHGYNQDIVPEMAPIFLAFGPNFKPNFTVPTASNVDLYPLLCDLLHVQEPPPNNGSQVLRSMVIHDLPTREIFLLLAMGACVALLLCALLYCRRRGKAKRLRSHRRGLDPQSLLDASRYSDLPTTDHPSSIMAEDSAEEQRLIRENWDV